MTSASPENSGPGVAATGGSGKPAPPGDLSAKIDELLEEIETSRAAMEKAVADTPKDQEVVAAVNAMVEQVAAVQAAAESANAPAVQPPTAPAPVAPTSESVAAVEAGVPEAGAAHPAPPEQATPVQPDAPIDPAPGATAASKETAAPPAPSPGAMIPDGAAPLQTSPVMTAPAPESPAITAPATASAAAAALPVVDADVSKAVDALLAEVEAPRVDAAAALSPGGQPGTPDVAPPPVEIVVPSGGAVLAAATPAATRDTSHLAGAQPAVGSPPLESSEAAPVAAKESPLIWLWGVLSPRLRRALGLLSAPLADQPRVVKDSVGWVAAWTVFLAACLWVYLGFVRQPQTHQQTVGSYNFSAGELPEAPEPADAKPAAAEHAEKASEGHGEKAPEGEHGAKKPDAKKAAKAPPKKPEKKPAKKDAHAKAPAKGEGHGGE